METRGECREAVNELPAIVRTGCVGEIVVQAGRVRQIVVEREFDVVTDARSGDVDAGVVGNVGYQCRIAVDDSVFRRLDFVEISHHFGGKGVGTGLFGGAVEVET